MWEDPGKGGGTNADEGKSTLGRGNSMCKGPKLGSEEAEGELVSRAVCVRATAQHELGDGASPGKA